MPKYGKDYFGFVYIWRDRKRKMYYVGSHMGPTTGTYVSSSSRMNAARLKRPKDFKRRILPNGYLSVADKGELHELEQYWLNMIKPEELGHRSNGKTRRYYNLKIFASGGRGPGFQHSRETKERMSSAQKGRTLSPKHVERLRSSHRGKTQSLETRKKRSRALKGRVFSPETLRKRSEALKGRTLSPEHRTKLSIAHMGHSHSPEQKKKISESLKRRPPASAETREKLSKALKGRLMDETWRKRMAAAKSKTWIVTFPDGHEERVINLYKFCKERGLNYSALVKTADKDGGADFKGFRVRRAEANDNITAKRPPDESKKEFKLKAK